MKHFSNVTSLSDLKTQYRELAKKNHPDMGGNKEAMQEINAEFKSLFVTWSLRDPAVNRDDEGGASAEGCQRRYWREYGWMGSNFARTREYDKNVILGHIRTWLKEAYPECVFSVRKHDYNSFSVSLMTANFWPFKDHDLRHGSINHYRFRDDERLSDRCREVFENVVAYVQSWNFDDSDSMTDYFHVNFYVDFEVGRNGRSFEYRDPMLKSAGPVFHRKVGPVGKKVREAIGSGNAFLHPRRYDREKGEHVIDETSPKYLCRDDENHYPLWYSQPSLVKARIEKLAAVGITARATRRGIELVSYSDELIAALAAEKAAEDERERAFLERLAPKEDPQEDSATEVSRESDIPALTLIDYSDKAFALVGDTRSIAARLRELGGRFNARLSCGPGWIFTKKREAAVRSALGMQRA
jgi:hypothetical protein